MINRLATLAAVFETRWPKIHGPIRGFPASGWASLLFFWRRKENFGRSRRVAKIQNEEDQVIDHCNDVMFICDVICAISSGIDYQKRSCPSQASQKSSGENQRKLDDLATGLDFVFGISIV